MARDRDSTAPPRRSGMRRTVWLWTKRVAFTVAVFTLAAAVALYLVLRDYEQALPSTKELKDYRPPQVTRVLARDGTLLAELFIERRTVVAIEQIPKVMKTAVLAAEDADFYSHEGLDYLGMLRALAVNLRSGRMVQGGSTITQQVVKNVLLTHERTFARKAQEVLLARRIEQELSKEEILELYLNHIYFGHGRYGVEEAARYYFGKGVADVTLAEAALIAGLAKGPSIYSPRVDPIRSKARRDQVLAQIALKGFADNAQVDHAMGQPVVLAPAGESLAELAPEIVGEVRRTLRHVAGSEVTKGGYTVTTTLDPTLQAAARKAVRDNLDAYAERHGLVAPIKKRKGDPFQGTPTAKGHHVYVAVVTGADDKAARVRIRVGTADGFVSLKDAARYNPKSLPASRFAEDGALLRVSPIIERNVDQAGVPHEYRLELGPQSALVAIDPKTHEIRALIGSYEAVRGGLDRASFAHRQPGSTFKPFVYAYGIHSRKLTPATVIGIEQPPTKDGDAPPPLLLRAALARSVNPAAEWALQEVGAENVVTFAKAMGISSEMKPTKSLALGAYELTPRELAAAYSTFAASGSFEPPTLITRIVSPDGADIALPPAAPRRRVMDDTEAYVVTSLLTSVVQAGTGVRARALDLPLAGKTGTSNDAKDAWFAGYSPELCAVVWTGFDDAMPLGEREQGATAALPAWIDFMRAAHHGRKVAAWKPPSGLVERDIDPATGKLAHPDQESPLREIFIAGSEPDDIADAPDAGSAGAGPTGGGRSSEAPGDDGAGGSSHVPVAELVPAPRENEVPPPTPVHTAPPF